MYKITRFFVLAALLVALMATILPAHAQACLTTYAIRPNNDAGQIFTGERFPLVMHKQGDLTQPTSYTLTLPPGLYNNRPGCSEGKGCTFSGGLPTTSLPSPYCSWASSYEWINRALPGTYTVTAVFKENGSEISISDTFEVLPPLQITINGSLLPDYDVYLHPGQSAELALEIFNAGNSAINYTSIIPEEDLSWFTGASQVGMLASKAGVSLTANIHPAFFGSQSVQWVVYDETSGISQSRFINIHVYPAPLLEQMNPSEVNPGEAVILQGSFLKLPTYALLEDYKVHVSDVTGTEVFQVTCGTEGVSCSVDHVSFILPTMLIRGEQYQVVFSGPHGTSNSIWFQVAPDLGEPPVVTEYKLFVPIVYK